MRSLQRRLLAIIGAEATQIASVLEIVRFSFIIDADNPAISWLDLIYFIGMKKRKKSPEGRQ